VGIHGRSKEETRGQWHVGLISASLIAQTCCLLMYTGDCLEIEVFHKFLASGNPGQADQ
jgi:hypothetical protein